MSNEKNQTEQALRGVAMEIEVWQKKRGLSDGAMCRQYAGLGSTKTYKRILNAKDDLEELNVDRQLSNYREVLTLLSMSGEDLREEIYADFSHVSQAYLAVTGAMKEQGNTRLVIVEGNPGTGKTAICDLLEARWPNVFVRAEASEIWKDSPMAMLKHLLLAVGVRELRSKEDDKGKASAEVLMPQCADERAEKLFDQLNERKLILALDEGHHLGPRTLNLLKTLINQTPTVVVLLAIPTLLARLTTKSYEEARQLTHNRLYRRVRLRGPEAGEVKDLLDRRSVRFVDKATAADCVKKLADRAASLGNWKYVVLVCRKMRELYKEPLTVADFVNAMSESEKER